MVALALVRYPPPDKGGWSSFWFHHQQHHNGIEIALSKKLGIAPISWQLWPWFPQDQQRILRVHQQAHTRFTSLLSVDSNDLTSLDLQKKDERDAWLWQNYVEHLGASERLGADFMPN